ncbi:hypothetical protein CMQ_5110 [Grosmannia clavigera kw1407]|uniref:F-box domain containing protein n=1 Tax=Grosmannia clavigera (strain kw1407 / UAMH 11150) TaxID=655863 RepID=F0XB82_GROCL|nr:uncharacterized protein CMQ_5110 [Grosmannia clavigera kw1407]EFX04848.1 hypothetical protein CMQ_5110 [Grosmannia clavigera kw1407]
MDDSPLGCRTVSLELLRQQVHLALNPDLDGSEFLRPDRVALLDPFTNAPADIQAANMQRVADGLAPFESGDELNAHFLTELPPEHGDTWEVPSNPPGFVLNGSGLEGHQSTASGNTQHPPAPTTAAAVPLDVDARLANYSQAMYNHHLPGFMSSVSSLDSQNMGTDVGEDIPPVDNLEPQELISEPNPHPSSMMWTDIPGDMADTLEQPHTGNADAIEYTADYGMNLDHDEVDSSEEQYTDNSVRIHPATYEENEAVSLPHEHTSGQEIIVSPTEKPELLTLPPNIFCRVCDYLPWSAKELMSRTCTLMRQRLHKACKMVVGGMNREEHILYQNDISKTLPLHVVCADCARLHRATLGDVPIVCYRSPNRTCPAKLMALPRAPFLCIGYCLEYHHVQLALKLRRLGLFPDHVNRIMQPYYLRNSDQNTYTSIEAFIRPILTVHESQPSFLVFKAVEFIEFGATYTTSLSPGTLQCLTICPHSSLASRDPASMRSNAIYQAIADARMGLFTRRNYSCALCPTDVSVHTLPGRLRIYAWHDFGQEGISPVDNAWRVHVGGPGNNQFLGPYLFHPRGTVKLRYEAERSYQPPNRLLGENEIEQCTLTSWAMREEAIVNLWNRLQGQNGLLQYTF